MTPCEEKGWKIGDKFEVVGDTSKFKVGSIVKMVRDDGDLYPIVELVSGSLFDQYAGSFVACRISSLRRIKTNKNPFHKLCKAAKKAKKLENVLAELNAMLPEGFEIVRKTSESVVDMSDWRNWRQGDVISCVDNRGDAAFRVGALYEISSIDMESPECETRNRIGIAVDGKGSTINAWQPRFFRFHSRPGAKP